MKIKNVLKGSIAENIIVRSQDKAEIFNGKRKDLPTDFMILDVTNVDYDTNLVYLDVVER